MRKITSLGISIAIGIGIYFLIKLIGDEISSTIGIVLSKNIENYSPPATWMYSTAYIAASVVAAVMFYALTQHGDGQV